MTPKSHSEAKTMFEHTQTPKKYAIPIAEGHRLQGTEALQAVREWRRTDALLLILAGVAGVGKSLAAAWALYDWWLANATLNPFGRKVYPSGRMWVGAPHLCRMRTWSDEYQHLEQVGFLVVDDLGQEEATDKALAAIGALLTTRFANCLPTVITTNVDPANFRERYGERLVDRLRECGLDENGKSRWWVKCGTESLRGVVEPVPVQRQETDVPEESPVSAERVDEMAASVLSVRGES